MWGAAASCSTSTHLQPLLAKNTHPAFLSVCLSCALLHSRGPFGAFGREVVGSGWLLVLAGARATALHRALSGFVLSLSLDSLGKSL